MKKIHVELKRLASIVLAMAMLLVSVPMAFPTHAAAAAVSGTTGDCTWELNGTVLTIGGNGAMGDYSSSSPSPWGTDITEVIILDGVMSIGGLAFDGCKGLAGITIPNSVTNIGSSAFSSCTSLINITIPNSVMHIGSYAFYGCTGLTDIAIPDSVTKIGFLAFFRCSNLESITVAQRNSVYHSDGNCLIKTANKELIVGCKNSVIPCDGTVTSIGEDAFYECTGLTEISIPDGVTSIGDSAFKYCTNLKVVSISNDVTSIDYDAFSDCTELTNITLSGSVTSIGSGVFRGCTALTSITIPDSVTSIGSGVFRGCTALTSITIPDSVTSIGSGAFSGCAALTSITIPDGVTNITADAFFETGYYYDERNWEDGVLYIGNHLVKAKNNVSGSYTIKPSVKTISSYAFMGCTALTSITIPDSVTSIGDSAFNNCSNLCIRTPENSYAHRYAKENNIRYFLTELTGSAARPVIDSSRMTEDKRLEVTLRAVDGYEYRCDDGAWQQSPVFGDLYLGGEHRFCQRIAATENHAAGVESEALCFTFIESITAVSTKELIENYTGYQSTGPDGSEYFVYYPQITYTVTYDGGKTFTGTDSELYGKFGESVSGTYQSYENQWHVGENTCSFSFMGVEGECKVTVTETPVKSLTINDLTIVENTGGYYSEELGYYIYADSLWPSGTVELKDGRQISFDGSSMYIDGEWYSMPSIDLPSQKAAPWTVGNSYEVTGNFLGVSTVFRVTIVPCPIESVSVGDVKVIAGTHGYENENGQYIYTTGFGSVPFSVKMRDGRVLTSQCGRIGIDETWYDLEVDLPDQTKDPWTVGSTHTLTARIGSLFCTFTVTIIDNPIGSLTIDPVVCTEGTHGSYNYEKGYYQYQYFDYQSFSVTLKDGTVVQSGVRVPATYNCSLNKGGDPLTLTLYGMNYGALLFDDTQDETHWGVGEHYITGSLPVLDISARMKVTVTESPVERLQIEDMLYVPDGESWRDLRPVYTLYFKDGTKKTVTDDATWREAGSEYLYFSINDDRTQDLADGETYEMTGSFGHLTDTFRVTVAAGIIHSLELVSPPAKTAYTVGECFDARGAVLRVGYSDGTSEDVALNSSGLHTQFEQAICLRKLNATVTVSWRGKEMLTAGQQKATITLLGRSVECPIEVTGSMPRALTVRVGADKTPIFTMTYNDGKTVDLRLLDFQVSGGYSDLDVGNSGGYIETDKGLFTYSWDGGVFTIGGAQSNALQDTEWFRRYQTISQYSHDSPLPSLRFSGQLTAENIDGLICHFCGSWSAGGSGAQIRKRLQEACGIDNADLSLSKHYNPATDTYRFTDFYRITPAVARRLTYQNGTWTMWAQLTDGTTYRATFDGDGRLLRLNAPGDLDGDGEVTDWDGVLLARYLAGWTMDAQDAAMLDIDGDGEVTDWDGVLLDRYLAGWDVTL